MENKKKKPDEKTTEAIIAYSRTRRLRDSITYKSMKKAAFEKIKKKDKEE